MQYLHFEPCFPHFSLVFKVFSMFSKTLYVLYYSITSYSLSHKIGGTGKPLLYALNIAYIPQRHPPICRHILIHAHTLQRKDVSISRIHPPNHKIKLSMLISSISGFDIIHVILPSTSLNNTICQCVIKPSSSLDILSLSICFSINETGSRTIVFSSLHPNTTNCSSQVFKFSRGFRL